MITARFSAAMRPAKPFPSGIRTPCRTSSSSPGPRSRRGSCDEESSRSTAAVSTPSSSRTRSSSSSSSSLDVQVGEPGVGHRLDPSQAISLVAGCRMPRQHAGQHSPGVRLCPDRPSCCRDVQPGRSRCARRSARLKRCRSSATSHHHIARKPDRRSRPRARAEALLRWGGRNRLLSTAPPSPADTGRDDEAEARAEDDEPGAAAPNTSADDDRTSDVVTPRPGAHYGSGAAGDY